MDSKWREFCSLLIPARHGEAACGSASKVLQNSSQPVQDLLSRLAEVISVCDLLAATSKERKKTNTFGDGGTALNKLPFQTLWAFVALSRGL